MAPSLNECPTQGWNDELLAAYHHQGKFMAAHVTWQRERILEGLKKLGGGHGWREGSTGNEELRHQGPHCPRLRQKPPKLRSYLIFVSTEFFLFIPRVVFFLNKFAVLSPKKRLDPKRKTKHLRASKEKPDFIFLAVGASVGHKWPPSKLQIPQHEVQLS